MTRFDAWLVTDTGETSRFAKLLLVVLWVLGVTVPYFAATHLIRVEATALLVGVLGAMIGAAKAVTYQQGLVACAKRRYWASQSPRGEESKTPEVTANPQPLSSGDRHVA